MASDRPTYPRLNMEKHNATDITLSIGIPWTDKMKALFHDVPMDTGGRFLSFATYKPRGATERHLLREYCHIDDGESGEEGTELHVTVEYTRDAYLPSSRVPRRLNRGGLLLSALARLTDPVSIHCHVAFAFSGEHETTVYPLPAPPGLANLPFDEIRGIRGVKRVADGGNDLEYSFVLDRPRQDIYVITVFSLTSAFTGETPNEVLEYGNGITRRLVVPLPGQGE